MLLSQPGCGGAATAPTPTAGSARIALTVVCADPDFADAVRQPARGWAAAKGATVEVVARPPDPAAESDIVILPAAEFGAWAERGDLLPIPQPLRVNGHPLQWDGVYAVYKNTLAAWGGQVQAIPLSGDAAVLVYRSDRLADAKVADAFRQKFRKPPPDPPATWEDVADLAEVLTALDKAPALPPLPAGDAAVADVFSRVAACYDRGSTLAGMKKGGDDDLGSLSFQFRVNTGRPRLDAPSFAAAAAWLARTAPLRRPDGPPDPAAALADGKAMLAVLSLADLARLPKENGQVPAKFGLAAVPGTRGFFPAGSPKMAPAAADRNYIPYFANVRVGAVRKRCPHPDKAFDLLAELGGPVRSMERVSGARLGAGPVRKAEVGQLAAWFAYGFDADRSKRLQAAMGTFVADAVEGPTFVLRGPDQASLTAALAAELRRVAGGQVPPDAGLKQAAAAWAKLDEAQKPDDILRWRRRSAGLP